MSRNLSENLSSLVAIDTRLKIEFSGAVGCELDEFNRQVKVGRMELFFEGEDEIPAGWRGKICMVSGINRVLTISDWIVLPAIVPGKRTPIGPILADEIPNDLLNSKDEWLLEFRIVDLRGNEKPLLRNQVIRRPPSDAARQRAELELQYRTQLVEKEKTITELQQVLADRDQQRGETEHTIQGYRNQVDALKKELQAKESAVKELDSKLADRNTKLNDIQNQLEIFRDKARKLEADHHRILQQNGEQKIRIESLQAELNDNTSQLNKLRNDVTRFENERDNIQRLAEEEKSKIKGLQAELEASQALKDERSVTLEKEIDKARILEKEFNQSKAMLVEQERIISDLQQTLHAVNAQLAAKHQAYNELQDLSSKTIVDRERVDYKRQQEIDAYRTQLETLEKQLSAEKGERLDRESKLADRNVELNETIKQRDKLRDDSLRLEKHVAQLDKDVEQLENERDHALRQAEELTARIEGLRAELTAKKEAEMVRVEEAKKTRELAWDLERMKEAIARHEKTIERLNQERNRAETVIAEFRTARNTLENRLSEQETTVERLREERSEVQAKLAAAHIEAVELQAKLEKMSAGQTLYHRYDLIRQLRASNSGEVYKVYDKSLDRAVTLKILLPAIAGDRRALSQLMQEAQALAKLNHINILRLYDFEKAHEPYIVMEYVDGRTLREVIDVDSPLPLERVLDYVEQICKGLAHAHRQGIYHGGLSPEHLMLTDNDFIKIMDFGMAATMRMSMTRMSGQTPKETLHYLSPEQIREGNQFDGTADIYSLGIIFYEMLNGQPPFTGEAVEDQHISETPQPIDRVPPAINTILRKCLAKNPQDRYGHVDDLRKVLRNINLAADIGK